MRSIRSFPYRGLLLDLACLVLAGPPLLFPGRYTLPALGLLSVPWLRRVVLQRRLVSRTPMDLPILGLLLMALLSTYVSADLSLSLPKLYGLLLGLTVFYVTVEHARTSQRRLAVTLALALAGVGISLLALVGTNWKGGGLPIFSWLYDRLPRLITEVQTSQRVATGFHPNEVAGTLTLLVPLTLAPLLFPNGRGWRRAWLLVASALGGAVLLLTQSRSGYMGLAFGLLLLGSLRWPGIRRFLPLLVLAPGGLLLWLGPERFANLFLAIEGATGLMSWPSRMAVWRLSLAMVHDFPFTGIGLNTFPLVGERLYPYLLPDSALVEPIPHAHDLFLQVGADLGLPGLAAFLVLLFIAWLQLYRAWKGGQERWLVAGLASGLLAYLIFSLTDAVTLGAKPGVLLWVVLGLIAALGSGTDRGQAENEGREARPSVEPQDGGLAGLQK